MKKKLQILLSLILVLLSSEFCYSQWSGLTNPSNGDIVHTTSTVTGIGIGTFAGNLGAVLHVNSSLTTAQTGSGAFATSEVFRTQVPSSTASNWRMFRGTDEMANFWYGSSANSLNITASRGAFRIATGATSGSPTDAFEIVGGTGSDKGWVGIGDWDDFNPNVDLHIHGRTSSDFGIQMTNGTVGTSTTDGLRLIMNNSGRATMYNWEDDDIAFGTGNSGGGLAERMIISSGINYGRVGIGTGPGAQLDVYDATDLTTSGDDIGFQVDEILASSNVANRGIAAELYAKNGTQTIGIATTLDNYNTTASAGISMYGMYITIRDLTGTSNTDYSNGIVIDNNVTSNNAEHKSGLIANIGANTSSITNSLTTSGCNLTAVSYNGTIYGGKFEAVRVGGGTGSSYGVWAKAPLQTCTTTAGVTTCAGAAGYFEGDVFATNTVYQSSDLSLKDNIIPLTNASTILDQLTPKQYTFNQQIHPNLNLPLGQHYGFISQEVETFLPGIVKDFQNPAIYDSLGVETHPSFSIKGLNYIEIIPILVGAVKEQKAIVDLQKATIDSLINALQNPTPLPLINPQNSQKISLSNVSSIIMKLPAAEQRGICLYHLPKTFLTAFLYVKSYTLSLFLAH